MTTDYRALLAVVAEQLDTARDPDDLGIRADRMVAQIREALAKPEQEGPTDQEIADTFAQGCREGAGNPDQPPFLAGARAVLARFAHPAIKPVPVAERLPGAEDCDAEGRCWIHQPRPEAPEAPEWKLANAKYASVNYGTTHWAPHYAMPVPTSQEGG